jgi:hypothetical protein
MPKTPSSFVMLLRRTVVVIRSEQLQRMSSSGCSPGGHRDTSAPNGRQPEVASLL